MCKICTQLMRMESGPFFTLGVDKADLAKYCDQIFLGPQFIASDPGY
jgi:hypothetical protein